MDVEGFEYNVFKGAESLLFGRDAPDIIFEFGVRAEKSANSVSAGADQQILLDMSYRIFYFNHINHMQEIKRIL